MRQPATLRFDAITDQDTEIQHIRAQVKVDGEDGIVLGYMFLRRELMLTFMKSFREHQDIVMERVGDGPDRQGFEKMMAALYAVTEGGSPHASAPFVEGVDMSWLASPCACGVAGCQGHIACDHSPGSETSEID